MSIFTIEGSVEASQGSKDRDPAGSNGWPNARSISGEMMNFLFEERTCSARDLQRMLQDRHPNRSQMLADMFAMGCLLHFQGERSAASMLIGQVFESVRGDGEPEYLTALLNGISGNELRLACEIAPSTELRELCDRARQGPAREAACAR